MSKKIFRKTISLCLISALMLTGCSSTNTAETKEAESTSEVSTEDVAEADDTVADDAAADEAESNAQTDNTEGADSNEVAQNNETTDEPSTDETSNADTPYSKHGALHVDGTQLTDANGEPFQLYGMSSHGIAWFPQYITSDTFRTLRDNWNTNCIRLAMYTAENSGYCTDGDKEYIKNLVKQGVDYATELGMYAIVDWHILSDQTPTTYNDEALGFFDEISKEYADNGNVLYEICNEPNGSGDWQSVKAYANEVIPVIKRNDPDAVILVGTPTWCQDVDQAMNDPLEFDNIMYDVHFYAATHTDWLRDRVADCIDNGTPIFVSEFGICDASGNGAVDYEQAEAWKKLIEKYKLSFMCWNLANKDESSSVLKPDCTKTSGWDDSELSEEGVWVTQWFRSK